MTSEREGQYPSPLHLIKLITKTPDRFDDTAALSKLLSNPCYVRINSSGADALVNIPDIAEQALT